MKFSIAAPAFGCIVAAGLVWAHSSSGAAPAAPLGLLQSLSVDLPSGNRPFPPGPNVSVISANCVTCHSSGMILNQPSLSKATWQTEVLKMINVYKAPVDPANVPAIVDYLAAVKGT